MELRGKKIGFCLTGSFYTFKNTIIEISKLVKMGVNIIPIMSDYAYNTDSKFGTAKKFVNKIQNITNNKIIHTIQEAEYLYKNHELDIMIIAPCSRKYFSKNIKFNNRYSCAYCDEKPFKRWKTFGLRISM